MWRRSDAAVGGDHAPKGRRDDEMTGAIEAKGRRFVTLSERFRERHKA